MMQECLARHRHRWGRLAWVENSAVRKALCRWVVFRSHYIRDAIRKELKRLAAERRKAKKRKAKERKQRGQSDSSRQRRRNAHHGKRTAS